MFRGLILGALMTAAASAQQPANPPRLSYVTYASTRPDSYAYALAVDSAGFAYVGGFDSSCAYLTKLNQTGTAPVWSVCLPVTHVNAVALDSAGSLYIAGLVEQAGQFYSTVMMKLTAGCAADPLFVHPRGHEPDGFGSGSERKRIWNIVERISI